MEEASSVERVDGARRKNAVVDGLDLYLERALSSEHRLDAREASAPEQARESQIDPVERILGERKLRLPELGARRVDIHRELSRFCGVGAEKIREILPAPRRERRGGSRLIRDAHALLEPRELFA